MQLNYPTLTQLIYMFKREIGYWSGMA